MGVRLRGVGVGSQFFFDPGAAFQDLNSGQSRMVEFYYAASDGHASSAPAKITITVTGQDDSAS